MKKRLWSILLAMAMCLTMLPVTALAANGEAVTTFEALKTAISNATGTTEPTEITISGSIEVTETLSINNKNIKLSGGTLTCANLSSHMFQISNNGSLTLESITLDGSDHGPEETTKNNCNLVNMGAGELTLNDGAILENNGDTAIYMNGAAVLTMNGGEIRNNTDMRDNGTGAAIYTPDNYGGSSIPTININGGKITGNSVGRNGGAIYLTNYANLNITGGEISGNFAAGLGGAIYIGTTSTQNRAAIKITGGTIKDNTAGNTGDNIYTRRDIVLGPNADIPSGIYLYYISGEARKLLLTGTPNHTIGLDGLGTQANWFTVAKMQDDSAVSEAAFQMLKMTDPSQSLVLADDGTVRIGTKISGDYPLDFTYVVWNGNSGSDNGTVGSQSGDGWNWNADTLRLTITDDVRAIATGSTAALSLPKGDVTIDIAEGKTLTVESPNWYALNCLGSLTITGGGTISTISGGSYTGGINASGNLSITDTKLDLTGPSNYFLHTWGSLTLNNCEVSVVSEKSDSEMALGIYADDNIVIENCKINVDLKLDETCSTEKKNASAHGIASSDGNISISESEVTVNTVNQSSDSDSYNYGIISYGGDVSIASSSQVSVTTADSSQPIGIVAVGEMTIDNSTVKSTTTNSLDNGFALEMLSYGGFKLNGVEIIQGQKYVVDDEYGYEEDITNYSWNTDDEDDYPKGGTSIIGIPVTGVTLDKETLDLIVGDSETLEVTIAPDNATIKTITWSGSDESIATVDENGNITAVGAGTATITATTEDGGYTATCEVTVTNKPSGGGSVATPTYPPSVTEPDNGDVTVSPTSPKQGDTVTITPQPDEGYEVDNVTVTDSNGKQVEIKDNGNGTYSFTQPSGKVTITVTFKATGCPKDSTCPISKFTDASATAWYHDGVHYVLDEGLMFGIGDNKFAPNATLTRAELAQILYNKAGKPSVTGLSTFTDVPASAWYAKAIAWAQQNNVVSGIGGNQFAPNQIVTREQIAVMLYNDAGKPEVSGTITGFADAASVSAWAYDAVLWATQNDVVNGALQSNGTRLLNPTSGATRAETAVLLKNFMEKK